MFCVTILGLFLTVHFRHYASTLKTLLSKKKKWDSLAYRLTLHAGKKGKEKNKETNKTNKEMKGRITKKHTKDVKNYRIKGR
jgi:hypothetical protein